MFSKVLDILDKPYRDAIYEYLAKNNKFNKTKEWLGLSIVLIIFMIFISILFLMKNYTYEPPVIYQVDKETVANNTYNKRLITLNSPRVTQQSLENWSIGFVNNMYNFDFNNFDKQLLNSKKYFTNAGYNAFVNSINKIALKENIENKKQIVTLTASGEPVIATVSGVHDASDGKRKWQIDIPAIMATTSGNTVYKDVKISMMLFSEEGDNNKASGLFVNEMTMNTSGF